MPELSSRPEASRPIAASIVSIIDRMIAAPTTALSSPGERVRDEGAIFRVDRMIDCGQQVLVAQGELDLSTVELLEEALTSCPPVPGMRLLVDLSHVTFMAWAGLQPLIIADENWRRAGGALLITAISPPVELLLRLARSVADRDGQGPAPRR
jgi:anti-anti-sigma factor